MKCNFNERSFKKLNDDINVLFYFNFESEC